jgi:hypothetical protein
MAASFPAPELILYTEHSTFGGERELRAEDGRLTCSLQACEGMATDSVTPDAQAWKQLWDMLEFMRAWDWSGSYEDPKACDAVRWTLEIRWQKKLVTASGCQRWPGEAGQFRRFLGVLSEMAVCDCTPQVAPEPPLV